MNGHGQTPSPGRTRDLLFPRMLSGQIDVAALSGDEANLPITNLY
jgi:hypothetical protein